MKKQLIGAATAILLLAGCGGSEMKTTTCSASSGGYDFDIILKSEDNAIKTITIDMEFDFGTDFSDEELEMLKPALLSSLGFEEGEDVKVDLSSKDGVISVLIEFDASADGQFMQFIGMDDYEGDLPLDLIVEELENNGATCK